MSNDMSTMQVVYAKTLVLIPFRDLEGQARWQSSPAAYDANTPMWVTASDTTELKGIDELLPHFRRLMTGQGRNLEPTWHRYKLHPRATEALLSGLKPGAWKVTGLKVGGRITALEATIFPTGEGVFGLEYTWDDNNNEPHDLEAITMLLPLLRRMGGTQGQKFVPFWEYTGTRDTPAKRMTDALAAAGRENTFQLIALLRALSGNRDTIDIAPTGLGISHTSVVLQGPAPSTAARNAALYHLAQASPPTFVVPSRIDANVEVLERRGNRFIGIAREGTAALAWPEGRAHLNSEIEWARQRFHGVYRLLHTHVHAERLKISELSDKAARFAGELDDGNILQKQKEIESLLIEVAGYTLSLTGEDCGGNGDHVAFFSALRKVHRIPAQRDELRAEIDELRALLRAVENKRAEQAASEERDFQKRVSLFGFFAVPLTLALAVLGANIDVRGEAYLFSVWESVAIVGAAGALGGLLWAVSRQRKKRKDKKLDQGH